jgi:hypothetical protein
VCVCVCLIFKHIQIDIDIFTYIHPHPHIHTPTHTYTQKLSQEFERIIVFDHDLEFSPSVLRYASVLVCLFCLASVLVGLFCLYSKTILTLLCSASTKHAPQFSTRTPLSLLPLPGMSSGYRRFPDPLLFFCFFSLVTLPPVPSHLCTCNTHTRSLARSLSHRHKHTLNATTP